MMSHEKGLQAAFLVAIIICPISNAASETLGYGSRIGMDVTILRKKGIDPVGTE